MDHAEATRTQAVERYLLGSLPPGARESFEEHYFDCAICSDEITNGVFLMDNAAAELKHVQEAKRNAAARSQKPSFWREWLQVEWRSPAFAMPMIALLAVTASWFADHGRLSGELAQANAPQAISSVMVENERGATPLTVERSGRFFAVSFFLAAERKLPVYRIDISGNGVAPATVTATQPPPGNAFNLLLPVARYTPGRYELKVSDGAGPALQTFSLNLK